MNKKKCSKCKSLLPTDNFYKDSRKTSGLASECKRCKKAMEDVLSRRNRDVRRYAKDKDKVLARVKARDFYGNEPSKQCAVLSCENIAGELHHLDYSKPLDVVALCELHHRMWHQVAPGPR
jgi:hypothetical protein